MNPVLLAWLQRRVRRRRSGWVIGGMAVGVPLLALGVLAGNASLQQLQQQCQPSSASSQGGGVFVSSGGWTRVGATIDPTYGGGAFGSFYNNGFSYAELGATPGYPNYVYGGLIGKALGINGDSRGIPGGYPLLIRAVGSNSPGFRILKSDIGSGQAGDLHYVIDLHPAIAQAIHFSGKTDVEIKPAGSAQGVSLASNPQQQCVLASAAGPGQYANPFAHSMAGLVPQRVDMGTDYDNVQGAEIDAIGRSRIVAAGTGIGGNWVCGGGPNGGVFYQLLDGPDAGRKVFVTEDVVPTVSAGQIVSAGQEIAKFSGGGLCIEIGFGTVPWGTEATAMGQPDTLATSCGQLMSQLIASLGGKPGVMNQPKATGSCPVM